MSEFSFYVGIDLGNSHHAVCVVDASRAIRKESIVPNDLSILELLTSVCDVEPSRVAIAVEDRNTAVVDTLLLQGFALFTINPKQVDRYRERHSVAGAKDDRRDARVIATALVTDASAFRRVPALSAAQVRLRVLNASYQQLVDDRRRLANQLRAVVLRFFPSLLVLCAGADERWFWALLLAVRSPAQGARVRKSTVAALLKAGRKRSVSADDVVAAIKGKNLLVDEAVTAASASQAALMVKRLRLLDRQMRDIGLERDRVVEELAQPNEDGTPSDVGILGSMPGIGRKSRAVFYADVGALLVNGELARLRALAGVAPVTKQSGKTTVVSRRHACSPRLREVLYAAASAAAVHDEKCKALYERHCARGHSHARAVRSVGDRVLHVLVAMFRSRALYTPSTTTSA